MYSSTPKRVKQILDLCTRHLGQRRATARNLSELAGVIISQFAALGAAARIRTRSLLRCVESRLRPGDSPSDRHTWDRHVVLSEEARDELRWWLHNLHKVNGQSIAAVHAPITFDGTLRTDASDTGWGGWITLPEEGQLSQANTLLNNLCARLPTKVSVTATKRRLRDGLDVYGAFTGPQAKKSSTWRELYGSLRVLEALVPLLQGGTYSLQFDNQGSVYLLGGVVRDHPDKIFGGSNKPELQQLVVAILDLAAAHNILLRAFWIPREKNERADLDSHLNERDHYDYTVKQTVFACIDQTWGPHGVDRFASAANRRLTRFNSRYFQQEAEWVDAFSTSWSGELNWLFPPPALIPRVITKMQQDRADATLVAPLWTGAHWWPLLFPKGTHRASEPFVTDVWQLGAASEVLCIPSDSRNTQRPNLPRGQIVAIKIRHR